MIILIIGTVVALGLFTTIVVVAIGSCRWTNTCNWPLLQM